MLIFHSYVNLQEGSHIQAREAERHPVTQVKSSKDILDRTRTAIDALKASSLGMVCTEHA